jgi:hypothetical protein
MSATKINFTQEMIDVVFGDPILYKKFRNPERAKRICEIRLTGATYQEIEQEVKLAGTHCRQVINKLIWIYQLCKEE